MNTLDDFLDSSLTSEPPSHIISGITKPIQISSIPRRIMQCGSGKRHVKSSKESIEKHMPSWDYNYYNHDDARVYIKEYYPYHIDLYDSLGERLQDDLFSYLWLHHNGGLVLDPDFEVLKPLDELFYNEAELYLAMNPDNHSTVLTSFMASKSHCQFWLDLVNHIKTVDKPKWAVGPYLERKKRTGESVISEQLPKCRHQYIMISPAILNPNGLCYSCRGGVSAGEDYYLRRIDGSLGMTMDEMTLNVCKCYKDYILYTILGIVVVVVICYIYISYTKSDTPKKDTPMSPQLLGMGYQGLLPMNQMAFHGSPAMNQMAFQGSPAMNQPGMNQFSRGGYPFIGYY